MALLTKQTEDARLKTMLKPAWTLRTLRRKLSSAGLPKWWVTKCCEAAKKVQGLSLVVGLEVFAGKAELSQAFID